MEYRTAQQIISKIDGNTTAEIDTITNVKLKGGKKNPFQDRVAKKTIGATVMLYNNSSENVYADMVKSRMVEEGKDPNEFTLKPRAWGERIENTPFIEHKEKQYLECIFVGAGKTVYLVDGEETPKEEIEGLETAPRKVSEESQGGIEQKVTLRTFSLESILDIRLVETA